MYREITFILLLVLVSNILLHLEGYFTTFFLSGVIADSKVSFLLHKEMCLYCAHDN